MTAAGRRSTLLKRELAQQGKTLAMSAESLLGELTVDVVRHIRAEINPVRFWRALRAETRFAAGSRPGWPSRWLTVQTVLDFSRTSPVAADSWSWPRPVCGCHRTVSTGEKVMA
jgi:hypothetical protein